MNHNTAKILKNMRLMPAWILVDKTGVFHRQLEDTKFWAVIESYVLIVFLSTLIITCKKQNFELEQNLYIFFVPLIFISIILMSNIIFLLFIQDNKIGTILEQLCIKLNISWKDMIMISKEELAQRVSKWLKASAGKIVALQHLDPKSSYPEKLKKSEFKPMFDDCVALGLVDDKAGWGPFWRNEEKPTTPESNKDSGQTMTFADIKSDQAIKTGWPQPEQ